MSRKTGAIQAFLVVFSTFSVAKADNLSESEAVEVRFSPRENTLGLLLDTIKSAKSEILVASYTFTSKPIALALLEAKKQGVSVKVVADEKSNHRSYTGTQFLANEGVPVRLNGNYPIHHNKFMIIDGKTVETGSFNYTAAAAKKNAENVLVIHNNPALAQRYAKEWERLWNESTELPAKY